MGYVSTDPNPDGDHANGLRAFLEEFEVGELWMLRPGEIEHVAVIARVLAIQPRLPAPLWLRPQ
jgi:hypothetical protein